jgi:hypothetical protein
MNSNISIELTDEQRDHLSNIYHNNNSSKLLTRKELSALVDLMIQELLDSDVGSFTEVTNNLAEEGARYYFNDVRVTPEEYEAGIPVWLKKRKEQRS